MQHRATPVTLRPGTRSRAGRGSRGFTLVEILIVIAIIALLGTIAFVGYRAVTRQGLTNRTRMTLSNVASIFAEYDAKTKLKRQPTHAWTQAAGGNATYYTVPPYRVPPELPPAFDFWKDYNPAITATPERNDEQEGMPAPSSVDQDSAAVRNTQIVLYLAAQIPSNKTLIDNVDAADVMKLHDNLPETATFDERQHPVLLDAWGNAIIFVPASGLRGVYLGDPPEEFVVTSVKVYAADDLPDGVVAPNARPFFASAGEDGVFGYSDTNGSKAFEDGSDTGGGDDNLYSFEK
jgi:prepilin-type N-terminal cleavage/methylation domain-containing protein